MARKIKRAAEPDLPIHYSAFIKAEPTDTDSPTINRFPLAPGPTDRSKISSPRPPRTAVRRRATRSITQDAYPRPTTPDYIKAETTDSSSTGRTPPTPEPSSSRRRSTTTPRRAQARAVEYSSSNSLFAGTITNAFVSVFSFMGDTFMTMVSLIKKPLSILLGIYLLAVVAIFGFRTFSSNIFMALAPVCKLPGVSLLDIPFCNSSVPINKRKPESTDFSELINLQFNFENILENSVGGTSMAFDLKKSEFAVSDLNTLVRVSDLQCRDELSSRLDNFIIAAKSTSRGLSKFGSSVNGVVDSLLSIDAYALRALEKAQVSQIEASSGNVIISWVLAPFKPSNGIANVETNVLATFVKASNFMGRNIQELILRAETALRDLNDLENRLLLIHDIVNREGSIVQEEINQVLAQLWTRVGGNRRKIAQYASHRTLLNNIALYRSKARMHVSMSLIRLQKMQSDLDDLRQRVASPGLLADAGKEDIPLEVHMETIRRGVKRLNSGITRAKNTEGDYMKRMLDAHKNGIIALDLNN